MERIIAEMNIFSKYIFRSSSMSKSSFFKNGTE